MAWKKKMVYTITAWIANYEESGYAYPSEKFYRETLEEAEALKARLLEDSEYEDVWISDEKEEREFWD